MKKDWRYKNGTPTPRKGYHWEPCPGEAHRNPYIDHCGVCMPLWNRIAVKDKEGKA